MRLIGLTGGIATGKSTVAALLSARGAAVVDADQLAREVVAPGSPALAEIAEAFGRELLDATGALDRPALAALVFSDPDRRHTLEAITHPRIAALMHERIATAMDGPTPLVVADIPLLFEKPRPPTFEGILLVHTSPAVQLGRLAERDGIDDATARQRLAAQMPIDAKRALATWVIDNGGTRAWTASQVDRWWRDVVDVPRTRSPRDQ